MEKFDKELSDLLVEIHNENEKEQLEYAIKNIDKFEKSYRKFPSGSIRDDLGDKPRLELLPFDLFYNRLGKVLTDGAKHYGSNNYRKGQPISSSIGSLLRHLSLYMSGDNTEDHASKIVFNSLNILNADEYYKNDPLINDIGDWFKDGKPTGEGNYEDKQTKKDNSTSD